MTTHSRNSGVKGGSFKTMGLFPGLQKGIIKKGYLNPTPIQRKSVPMLLRGSDVIAMARTGSGKTAAFAIPVIQKLRSHSPKVGVRALILSPTRELALQTTLAIQQLAKYTDLRIVGIVGGDSLEEQFSLLAANPDIVVATPGRLVHLCVEARLTILRAVEIFVLDEADRMFEMGFAAQLSQVIDLMNENCIEKFGTASGALEFRRVNRQCALFSATLPQQIVDFARIGLKQPEAIRLDADGRLSQDLKTLFFHVTSDFKESALMYCLLNLSSISRFSFASQALIFVATKHHAEYLSDIASRVFSLRAGAVYGTMDQEARVDILDSFRGKELDFLFVTDLAARGLDIPLLDAVINYDFPSKAKLFVHRVGRVARNGRPGAAISLISPDELPYFIDLQLFLGDNQFSTTSSLGSFPQSVLDDMSESIKKKKSLCRGMNFDDLKKVMLNASKLYCNTRPSASPESYQRAKGLICAVHPLFEKALSGPNCDILHAIRSYKRHQNLLNIPEIKHKVKQSPNASFALPTKSSSTDSEFFLTYNSSNHKSSLLEKAYALDDSVLDLKGDEHRLLANKKKGTKKIIREEKTNVYEKWRKKNQLTIPRIGECETKSASRLLSQHNEKRKRTQTYLSRRQQGNKKKPSNIRKGRTTK